MQLIQAVDETHLWAESYDLEAMQDVLDLQSAVASRVARSMALELLTADPGVLARAGTTSTAAFNPNSCDVEPLFANPGLLSLIMPAVWETALGVLDMRFLTPLGPTLFPHSEEGGLPIGISPNGMVSFDGNPLDWFGGDDEEQLDPKSAEANYDGFVVELGERASTEVAGRTLDTWSVSIGDLGVLQVDDEGKVVRADLDADAGSDIVARWIRVLFPSEY